MSILTSGVASSLESVPRGEEQAIAQVDEITRTKLLADYPPGSKLTRRDAHPKSHGLVRATFTVDEYLAPHLAVGVFQPGKSYDCWIRFSNGFPTVQADKTPDVRGMAIKLIGVPGDKLLADETDAITQDFLLANHPTFFIKDVADYVDFIGSLDGGSPLNFFLNIVGATGAAKFFKAINPFRWRPKELSNLLSATKLKGKIESPTTIRYWSQLPYALGDNAVKYSVVPRSVPAFDTNYEAPNYMRETLVSQLKEGDVLLYFHVQVQSNAHDMPVEDPRLEWNESDSPFKRVATIRIQQQDFDNAERDKLSENMSFTPWHALPEHRPLGGINRARRVVYESISRLRHAANGVIRKEPVS